MATERDAILDKIKKLQRLADRAGTPEEAALAASRIQEMLFKYNLSMEQVDGHAEDDGYGAFDLTLDARGTFNIHWHQRLAGVIAHTNFCQPIQYKGQTRMVFIGERHNVEVVIFLYQYLAKEIKRLGLDAMRMYCASPLPGVQGAWCRSFALGAVQTIGLRLYAQQQRSQAQESGGTAMVHVKSAALAQASKRLLGYDVKLANIKHVKGSSNAGATFLGQKAGREIPLTKAMPTAQSAGRLR